jgi:hypothetical protein
MECRVAIREQCTDIFGQYWLHCVSKKKGWHKPVKLDVRQQPKQEATSRGKNQGPQLKLIILNLLLPKVVG